MEKPIENDGLEKFLLELAMYQDQLLQSYRQIFIASQSILISVAMLILIDGNGLPLSLIFYAMLFFGIGLILFCLWRNITENRELDVSYCHMQLLKVENNDPSLKPNDLKKPWSSFKEWQKKTKDAKKCELNKYCPSLLSSITREKMNRLPWYFLTVWILGIIIGIIIIFNNQYHFFDFL